MKREEFLKCGLFRESEHVGYVGEESVNTGN